MKFLTFDYYKRKWIYIKSKVDPMYSYWYSAKKRYKSITGKRLNYRSPKDLNEKLMWLTRYWQHPLKTKCADKYLVREYLKECGLENLLVPLIAVYNNADDINFDLLPNSFILKCNHGCGFNIIVRNKNIINESNIKKQLNQWMECDYDKIAQELHYHYIPHKIVCEELVSTTSPSEYQIRMINGKPITILACKKYDDNCDYIENAYNLDWTECKDYQSNLPRGVFKKPQNLECMLKYATILAKPFPFVRVDFYEVNGKVFFAELTFTPSGNILEYSQPLLNKLGKQLVLPSKYVPTTFIY